MLDSLGLAGDGDEVDAIEAVEAAFGVVFDQADASGWRTVGDVFASLLRRLRRSEVEGERIWSVFVQTIGQGAALSVDEVRQVAPDTKLIKPSSDRLLCKFRRVSR